MQASTSGEAYKRLALSQEAPQIMPSHSHAQHAHIAATERTTKKHQAFCGVTTKGLAANEQPPQHIMPARGQKVRRTGQISGTSAL